MKRILTLTAILSLTLMTVSCNKENPDPEPTVDWHSMALTTITPNSDTNENAVIAFASASVMKKSEIDGKSEFCALSNGKMVYDAFVLNFYFNDIKRTDIGQTLDISDFSLWFPYSSDTRTNTHSFSGTVSLAEKAEDHVVLYFHQVSASNSFGEYVTNGQVYCTLVP